MVGVVAETGGTTMNYHHVFQFPNDNEATLEAVLGQTKTGGIISSPMNDMLLIC